MVSVKNTVCHHRFFRKKVETVVTKLHEAVGEHPGVILWHISNELGGECYCPLCVKRFQN